MNSIFADKTCMWSCIGLGAGFLLLTIILDLHFRLIIIIGAGSILYTAKNKLSKLHGTISADRLGIEEEILLAQGEQEFVKTLGHIDSIHTSLVEAERDKTLEIATQKALDIRRFIESQKELQELQHKNEYDMLEEWETRENEKSQQSCQERRTQVEEEIKKISQLAESSAAARLRAIEEKRKRKEQEEKARLTQAQDRATAELNRAKNNYKL